MEGFQIEKQLLFIVYLFVYLFIYLIGSPCAACTI